MDSVRNRLIEATFYEVYENGYHAASLSSILNRAKAKKGSMYHYFSSKKEMVLYMIDEKIKTRIESYWSKLEACEKDILELLISILKDTSSRDFKRGCPLGNLLQEFSCEDKEFSISLNSIFSIWQELLEKTLKKAYDYGEIVKIDFKNVSMFIIASLEGALLLSKQSSSKKEYIICMEQLEFYLMGFKNL